MSIFWFPYLKIYHKCFPNETKTHVLTSFAVVNETALTSDSCGFIGGRGDAALEDCESCWGIIPLWSSHLFNLASVSQGSSFPMDDRFESLAIGGVGHPLEDWPLFSSWSSVWSTPERRDSASIQVKEGN